MSTSAADVMASINSSALPAEYRALFDDIMILDEAFLDKFDKITEDESKTTNQLYNEIMGEIRMLPADQQAAANRILAFIVSKIKELKQMCNAKIPHLSNKTQKVMNEVMKLFDNYDIPVKQMDTQSDVLVDKASENVQEEIAFTLIEVLIDFAFELIFPVLRDRLDEMKRKIPKLSRKAQGVATKMIVAIESKKSEQQINDEIDRLIEEAPEDVQVEILILLIEIIIKFGFQLFFPIIQESIKEVKGDIPKMSKNGQKVMNKIVDHAEHNGAPEKRNRDQTGKTPVKAQLKMGIAVLEFVSKFAFELIYPVIKDELKKM